MRILAVDDDESVLELLTEFLSALGYANVETAMSGKDALDIISAEDKPFDVLLFDIQMPEMSGVALCQRVRNIPEYRNVPIVMLTAMLQKKYIDDAFAAGATDYVTKPFDFSELQGRLADAQRLARQQKASHAALSGFDETRNDVTAMPGFKLADPLRIDGLAGVVGYSEFENYVLQMSRTRLLSSYVVAVKIRNIDRLFARLSQAMFRKLIMVAGKVISENVRGSGNLVSYRGNGVYLIIHHGRKGHDWGSFEAQFEKDFSVLRPDDMSDQNIGFLIGEAVHLRSITKSAAIFSLNIAVESVENKNDSVKELVVHPNRIFRKAHQSDEQRLLEQRAYQVLLKDVCLEERGLSSLAIDNRD